MKKVIKRIVISWLLVFLLIPNVFAIAYAEEGNINTSNRFNVVFVLDSSGSMNSTDPKQLRFDATKLFLGLLADKGNCVGGVVFSTDIIKTIDMAAINSSSDKSKVESQIENCKVNGWTAIGTALNKGVNMLLNNGDKSLPSVIVLLSDGKSELASEESLNKCNEQKAKAINNARQNNIQIHTVGLNSDGGADIKELKQISDATGGVCEEVKTAADLKNVFARFYNLIYETSTTTLFNGKVSNNGVIKNKFNVPKVGVEEVNIIISSQSSIRNLELEKPNGEKMSIDEVKKITTTSKSFSITKISDPMGGEWKLTAKGKAGDNIKIDMVYNDCLSVGTECDTKVKYKIGDNINIKGYLYNNKEKSKDGYEDYEATLFVTKQTTDNDKDNKTKEYKMEVSEGSYNVDIPIDSIGSYKMYMQVVGNGIDKSTKDNIINIDVGNSAPVVKQKKIEKHFYVIPFYTKEGTVEMSGAVTDNEDKTLKYSVESSSFKDTSYKIDGTKLIMTDFNDLSEGSFTIKATDSMGASAEFDVNITTTNVGILTLIGLGIAGLIVIIIIVIVTYIALNKRFMGDCYVSTFNHETGEYSEEVKRTKGRGRIRLSAFGLHVDGFDMSKCYLQATNKEFIYFISKKPVYGGGLKSKKIKIQGFETQITKEKTSISGLKVRFVSKKSKNTFF